MWFTFYLEDSDILIFSRTTVLGTAVMYNICLSISGVGFPVPGATYRVFFFTGPPPKSSKYRKVDLG